MKDLGLLLLRVISGGTLIAHGYPKLFGGEGKTPPQAMARVYGKNFHQAVGSGGAPGFAKNLEQMGVPYPQVSAYLAGAAEFGGGLGLLTGTMTRLAALAVIFNMGVAIRKVHWQTGFFGPGGFELPAQLLAAAATLFLTGPGAYSIDALLSAGKSKGIED